MTHRIRCGHLARLWAILLALVAERKRQGLSLADRADRTDIAKPNLSQLENSGDTLKGHAQAVGKTGRAFEAKLDRA